MYISAMDWSEIIRLCCVKRKISVKELAALSGQTGQNLYNKLNRNDWKQSELQRVFDALNVEVRSQVIDKETGEPFSFQ